MRRCSFIKDARGWRAREEGRRVGECGNPGQGGKDGDAVLLLNEFDFFRPMKSI